MTGRAFRLQNMRFYPSIYLGRREDRRIAQRLLRSILLIIDVKALFELRVKDCDCATEDKSQHALILSTGTGPNIIYTGQIFFLVRNHY